MRNKFLLLLLVCGLLLPASGILAENAAGEPDQPYQRAAGLLDALGLEAQFEGAEQQVSRVQFVTLVTACMGFQTAAAPEASVFEDVSNTQDAASVNRALQLGLITGQKQFRPAEAITYAEAVKICVSATGYEVRAILAGGYPAGFFAMASQTGMTENISCPMTEALTQRDALVLLYNMLGADLMRQVNYGEEYRFEVRKDVTLLTEYFKVYQIKGIVTANSRTALTGISGKAGKGRVKIAGELYEMTADREHLGNRVLAYVRDNGGDLREAIAVFPDRNEEMAVETERLLSFGGNTMTYHDAQEKTQRLTLAVDYDVIYNGKAYAGGVDLAWLQKCESLRLLDNNGDGDYDVIFAEKVQYTYVSRVNEFEGMIYDANDEQHVLDLSDPDCEYTIYSAEDQKYLQLYELQEAALLAATVSEDGLYVKIDLCGGRVTGRVDSVDRTGGSLVVDGEPFEMTAYFMQKYPSLSVGAIATFLLGRNGKVVMYLVEDSSFRLGYVIKVSDGSGIETPQIKLLDQNGKMQVLELAARVGVDGSAKSAEETRKLFISGGETAAQLIRYLTNKEGKISKIDTAEADSRGEAAVGSIAEEERPEDNRLILYTFAEDTSFTEYMYRSGTGLLWPKLNLASASVFMIPAAQSEKEEDKNYSVGGKNSFTNDRRIPRAQLKVYNLDEYGSPAAVVFEGDVKNTGNLDHTVESAVVESTRTVVTREDEIRQEITVFGNGSFQSYYLDENIVPEKLKTSGKPLCPGDIVRFTASGGEIATMTVDFDASPSVMAKNGLSNAIFNGGTTSLQYQSGKLYSLKGSFMNITPQPSDNAITVAEGQVKLPSYSFAWAELRNFAIAPANVVVVQLKYTAGKNGEAVLQKANINPGSTSELVSYLDAGGEADYVVLRQNYMDPRTLYAYKITAQ